MCLVTPAQTSSGENSRGKVQNVVADSTVVFRRVSRATTFRHNYGVSGRKGVVLNEDKTNPNEVVLVSTYLARADSINGHMISG